VNALKGRTLRNAQKYLQDVLEHKQAIPFRRFVSCVGRKAQGKMHKDHSSRQVRWPQKSVKHVLNLLQNAEANAEVSFDFLRRRVAQPFQPFLHLLITCALLFSLNYVGDSSRS
jgi:ribosomal protein L22